jgi:peptidoglycan-associated lipoprotein
MKKLPIILAVSASVLLSACSSTPDRSPGQGSDSEVSKDTAPGLGGSSGNQGQESVEVIGAGQGGSGMAGQDISSPSGSDMRMVDVNTIYEPVIYFAYDQFELDQEGTDNVRYHADILMANPRQKVTLSGHTDERGTPEYNLALGEKRAKSVAQAMMLFGIEESRIEVLSLGEEQPADAASNETAWQKNRRVEIIIK